MHSMGLYGSDLAFGLLCLAVPSLQFFWLLCASDRSQETLYGRKHFLTSVCVCICVSLAAATLLRLFPGNHMLPGNDSAVFLYIGKRMQEGKLPYRDLFDHKGPVLYLIEYLGLQISQGNTAGVWLLEVLNLLATSVLMLRLGTLTAKNRTSIFLAVFAAVGICGWKCWEGGNYTEEYALPWITMAAFIFFRFFRTGEYRLRDIFALGFGFSAVFLLRANMVAVWAAFLPVVLILFLRERRFPDIGKCLLSFLVGASALILPVLLWALEAGCLKDMWRDYILFNFAYADRAAEEIGLLQAALLFAGLVWPGTAAQLVCLISEPKNRLQWYNALFYLVSLLSAGMSGRGYYHYAIILLPGMIIPFASFFDLTEKLLRRLLRKTGAVDYRLIMLSFLLAAGAAFLYRHVSSGADQEEPVVRYLTEHTDAGDDVLILGNSCRYYIAADRKTENRFFYQIPPLAISSELYADFEEELERHPSDLILLPGGEEERTYMDEALKGIRQQLLNGAYRTEEYDWFEVFLRQDHDLQQGDS